MNSSPCCRFLRPFLQQVPHIISASERAAYVQFYSAARKFGTCKPLNKLGDIRLGRSFHAGNDSGGSGSSGRLPGNDNLENPEPLQTYEVRRDDVRRRVNELGDSHALNYPRIKNDALAVNCAAFRKRYSFLKPGESSGDERHTLRGRIYSTRIAGSKLAFLDVLQDGHRVQGICNLARLEAHGVTTDTFKEFFNLARRGDIISITGTPSRTQRGELSLNATELPIILSPCLASLPNILEDPETRIRDRHIDFLVNKRTVETMKLRSHLIQHIRDFLLNDNFLEVQTPILAHGAGGASARPFLTTATEFVDKSLSLRIAPEIWLKRLVLGGMDRVFEIGPAFRNEGIDATHNPEFTTCEFYKSFANLEELIEMTEGLISGLALRVNSLIETRLTALQSLNAGEFCGPFNRIEFIPALESAMGLKLPDLSSENASEEVASIFNNLSLPLTSPPTLPRLLDKLSSIYLEGHCIKPTFIVNPPSCLAPLAKSFYDPTTNQFVSARAELFIGSREIANMYEEENSPFEQRKKFLQQVKWRDDENHAPIDENYVEALEWALPPTGGWGCGVDRLCMLFSGASRISDVLSFGSLRNVVALGKELQ